MKEAAKASNNSADQFVLLGGTIEAAREAGDLPSVFEAADILAWKYEVDGLAIKADAVTKANLRGASNAMSENVQRGLSLIGSLEAAGQLSTAARLINSLQSSTSDPGLRAVISKSAQSLEEERSARQRLGPVLEKLKTNPDEPSANLEAGKYFCYMRHDWNRGLPMLAKASDPVAAVAKADLARPTASGAQGNLGDAWWALAQTQAGMAKASAQTRAALWYEKALPEVTGLKKAVWEKRIAQAAEDVGGASLPPSPSKFQVDAAGDWQETLKVAKGDRVTVKAKGSWSYNINQNLFTGPDGPGDGERYLEGRVGDGPAFKLGATCSFTADAAGVLQMRMNDSIRSDNSGHLDVQVVVSPAR